MPQSLAKVYLHLVFSTKDREPILADAWRDELFRVLDSCGIEDPPNRPYRACGSYGSWYPGLRSLRDLRPGLTERPFQGRKNGGFQTQASGRSATSDLG